MLSMDEVTSAARATRRAVRLWEKAGLLGEVKRNERGQRVFTVEQRDRAQVVQGAQMAGMTIAEIKTSTHGQLMSAIADACGFLKHVFNREYDL